MKKYRIFIHAEELDDAGHPQVVGDETAHNFDIETELDIEDILHDLVLEADDYIRDWERIGS